MNIFLDNFDNQFSLDTVTCPTLADMFTKGPEVNKVYDNFITTFSIHTLNPLFLMQNYLKLLTASSGWSGSYNFS